MDFRKEGIHGIIMPVLLLFFIALDDMILLILLLHCLIQDTILYGVVEEKCLICC